MKEVTAVSTATVRHVKSIEDSITSLYGFTPIDAASPVDGPMIPRIDDAVSSIDDVHADDALQPFDDRRIDDIVKELPVWLVIEHADTFGLNLPEAIDDATLLVRHLILRQENPQVPFPSVRVRMLHFNFWLRIFDYFLWHSANIGKMCYQGNILGRDGQGWQQLEGRPPLPDDRLR